MKLILIHDSVEDDELLIQCFKSDCLIKKVSEFVGYLEILDTIENLNQITHLTFVYRFCGDFNIPFFNVDSSSNYQYFNSDIISLINLLKTYNENIIVDILTCNLNDDSFVESVDLIETDLSINIRYSLDQTGNEPEADWVLESDNINVKDEYFNDSIQYWDRKLDSTYSNYTASFTLGSTHSYTGPQHTVSDTGTVISVNIFTAIWAGSIKCYMRKFTAATGLWTELQDGTWVSDNTGTVSTVKWRKVPLPETITVVPGDRLEIRHTSLQVGRNYQCGLNAGVPITSFTVENNITSIASPLSISTPCLVWLDAADLSSNGSSVTSWNDKSGQGNNATGWNNHNATGTYPTALTNGLNNRTVINLSGANDYFKINNNLLIYEVTFVILVRILAVPGTQDVRYGIINTDRPGFYGYGIGFYGFSPTPSSSYKFELLSNDAFTNTTVSVDNTGNTWYILTATYNANTTYAIFTYNGTILSPNVGIGAGPVDANDGIKIGIWSTSYLTNTSCYVAEAMVYNGVLSNGERQSVEGYLATKWGLRNNLPSSHPFFLGSAPGAPTSVTATPGNGQATVSWVAPASNGGSAITSYTVTSSPGGLTATTANGSTTTATVTGLTNGTIYTFTVTATNAYGTSSVSTASSEVVPVSIPITLGSNFIGYTLVICTTPSTASNSYWERIYDFNNGTTNIYMLNTPNTNRSPNANTSIFIFTGSGGGGESTLSTGYTMVQSRLHILTVYFASSTQTKVNLYHYTNNTITSVTVSPNPNTIASNILSSITNFWLGRSAYADPYYNGNYSEVALYNGDLTLNNPTTTLLSLITASTTNTFSTNRYVFGGANNFMGMVVSRHGTTTPTNSIITLSPAGTGYLNILGGFATVPSAPQNPSASLSGTTATITWSVPSTNGGSSITEYIVTRSPGGTTSSVAPSKFSTNFSSLVNGTTYTFSIVAKNAVGNSISVVTNSVTPATVPGAPTSVTATAGNGQATVSWVAPSSNGGSDISGYIVTSSPGSLTASVNGLTTTATVTGLSNGTSYTFTVRATNAIGNSTASSPSNSVTPSIPPNAPTNIYAVAGNTNAAVSWTAPVSNGGTAVTSYTITSTPGNITKTTSSTYDIITGLTNGVSYTFTVFATNSGGNGTASISSNTITPNSNLYIYFDSTVPASYPGSGVTWTSIPSNADLKLQLNNTTYSNGIVFNGTSAYAGQAGSLTPTFPSTPLTIIYWLTTNSTSSQTLLTLNRTASNIINQLYIATNTMFDHGNNFGFNSNYTFSIPTSTVTQYVFKRNGTAGVLYTNGVSRQNITANLSVTYGSADLYVGVNYRDIGNSAINGFFNGTIYAIKVFSSALSDADITTEYNNGITPSAPFNALGTVSGNTATLSWSVSLFRGYGQTPNYLIYDATTNTLLQTITNSSTTTTVPIDSSSNLYIIASNTVNSVNYNSSIVYFTETFLTPNEPRNVSVISGINQITLSWLVPTSNGSSSVTGYRVEKSTNNINWSVDISNNLTTSYISTGLVGGQTYYYRVYAINGNGLGMVSSTVSQIPNSVAQQISAVGVIPYHQSVDLSWNIPVNLGTDISSYLIESSTNGSSWTIQSSNTQTTYYTVSGLTNGTLYYFRISTINAAGTSTPSASVTATPIAKPNTPSITEIIGGNHSMNIFYNQSDNGGPTITRYRYTTNGGETVLNRNIGLVNSPWYSRSLTNGQIYNIQISSYNINGWSRWSNIYIVTPNDTRSNNFKNEVTNITKNNIANISNKLLADINVLSLNQARQFIHDLADDISGQSNDVKKATLLTTSMKMIHSNNALKNIINEELENYGIIRNIPFDISDQILVSQLIDISSQFKVSTWSPSRLSFILPTLNNEITIDLNEDETILSLEPDISYTLNASYNGIMSSNQYSMTYYRTDISRYVIIDNQEKFLGDSISFVIGNKVINFKFNIFGSPGGSSQDPGGIIDKASTYNGKSVIITFEPTSSNSGNGTVFGVMDWPGNTGLSIRADTTSNVRWERRKDGTVTTFDSSINGTGKFIAVTTFDESGNQFSADLYTWDGNTNISNVYTLGLTDLSTNTANIGDDYRNTLGSTEYNFSNDIFKGYIYTMILSSTVPSISDLQNIISQYNILDNGATITFDSFAPYYNVTGVKVGGISIVSNRFYLDGVSNFIRLDPGGSYSLDTTLAVTDLSAYSFNGVTTISFTEPSDLSGIDFYKVVFSPNKLNSSQIYDFSSNTFVGTINTTSADTIRNNIIVKSLNITGLVNDVSYNVYVMSYNSTKSNSSVSSTNIIHDGGIYNPRRYIDHLNLIQGDLGFTVYDIYYDINGDWVTMYKDEASNTYYVQNVYVDNTIATLSTYPTVQDLFNSGTVAGIVGNIPGSVIPTTLNSTFNSDGSVLVFGISRTPVLTSGYGPTLSIPDKVNTFSSTSQTSSSITLEWTQPYNNGGSEILGYSLYYYKTTDGSGVSATDISGITDLSYNVTGLLFNTQYTFELTAYNSIGKGIGFVINVNTIIFTFNTPSIISSINGNNQVELIIQTNNEPGFFYEIEYFDISAVGTPWSTNIDGDGSVVSNGNGSWTITGPNDGNINGWSYIYKRFTNSGSFTYNYFFSTVDSPIYDWLFSQVSSSDLSNPTNINFNNKVTENNYVSDSQLITYSENDWVAIGIYSSDSVAGPGIVELTNIPNESGDISNSITSEIYDSSFSRIITGLTNGKTYQFRVRAFDNSDPVNYSSWSDPILATPEQTSFTFTFDDTQNYVGGYLVINHDYPGLDISFNWYSYTDNSFNNPVLLSNLNNRNYLFVRFEHQNLYIGCTVNYSSETFTSSLILIQEKYNPDLYDYNINVYTVGQKQSLFNTATYYYPDINTPPVYNLDLSLNQISSLLSINRSKTFGSNPNVNTNGFETSWKPFGERLLEIVAMKIFGHPKARAAISNDNSFYDTEQLTTKVYDAFNNHKNEFGNYYMGIYDITETNSEEQLIDVTGANITFPFYLKGITQKGYSPYFKNGPNVGGSLLVNGEYNIPLLLTFK